MGAGGSVESHKSDIQQGLNQLYAKCGSAEEPKAKKASAKTRLSFTADLGGIDEGLVVVARPEAFAGTYAKGDRVEVDAPKLEKQHGKQGTIIEDLGETPNGLRIAVKLDGDEEELQLPPQVLVRIAKPVDTEDGIGAEVEAVSSGKEVSNASMRGDRMSGCLEFIKLGEEEATLESSEKEEEPKSTEAAKGDAPPKAPATENAEAGGSSNPVNAPAPETVAEGVIVETNEEKDTTKEKKAPAKTRLSFTADLGGINAGLVVAVRPEAFADTYAKGDRVEIDAPQLEQQHGKQGTIIEDLGETPNGLRIAIKLDGEEEEIQLPPQLLVRVAKPLDVEEDGIGAEVEAVASGKKVSNACMRGDKMSGCLEFVKFGEEGAAPEGGESTEATAAEAA